MSSFGACISPRFTTKCNTSAMSAMPGHDERADIVTSRSRWMELKEDVVVLRHQRSNPTMRSTMMTTPWSLCPKYDASHPWTPERVEVGGALLSAVLEEFPSGSAVMADVANLRTGGRFKAELREAALHVGCTWRDVMLANISYDLAMYTIGCSTAALAGPEGPVLVRNLDWWPERELVAASEAVWDDGTLRATWPGFSGVVTGMSRRGFAVAINAVGCTERAALTGWPVLLYLRAVLDEASDFHDAVERLATQKLAAPALLTVVGRTNDERVVIERTPRRAKLRRPEGHAPLVTTNDYRLMAKPEHEDEDVLTLYATACSRFEAMTRYASELTPEEVLDDEALLTMLHDPRIMQDITVQHVIARPSTGEGSVWAPRMWM